MRTLIPTLLILVSGALAAGDAAPPTAPPVPAPTDKPADKPAPKPTLTLAELPEAVRTALVKQADGAEPEKIKAEEKKGVTSYNARWTKDGVRHEVQLAADGHILQLKAERRGKDAVVSIDKLPEAVRAAVTARLGGGQVTEVEQEEDKGKTVYTVEIERATDRLELELSAEGTIMEEKVKAAEAAKKDKGGKKNKDLPPPMPMPAPAPPLAP